MAKKKIVFLTGAGMSVESGFKTFRGNDGLWEEYPVEQVASHEGWLADPVLVNNFYNRLRRKLYDAKPNEGHRIISAMEKDYDVVVVIRGGGATSDLSGFDTLRLAENVCNFPLPIITGIGHERDESILDLVAWRSVKTPTAAAAFLIEHLSEAASFIDEASERIVRCVTRVLQSENTRLERITSSLPSMAQLVLRHHRQRLEGIAVSLSPKAGVMLQRKSHRLEHLFALMPPLTKLYMQRCRQEVDNLAVRTSAADPRLILKRGYSITTMNGKIVRDAKNVSSGQEIETQLANGKIKSITK